MLEKSVVERSVVGKWWRRVLEKRVVEKCWRIVEKGVLWRKECWRRVPTG